MSAWMLLAVAVVAMAGCHKSVEREKREVEKATAAAERKAFDAARELEHGNPRGADRAADELREAAEEVRREREDVAEAVARERVQYKKMLAKEISSIDRRVVELQQELARAAHGAAKDNKERDISAARQWRARLKHDVDDLERTGETDWTDLKDRIDHDLEDERPASVPRSFEKSYGI